MQIDTSTPLTSTQANPGETDKVPSPANSSDDNGNNKNNADASLTFTGENPDEKEDSPRHIIDDSDNEEEEDCGVIQEKDAEKDPEQRGDFAAYTLLRKINGESVPLLPSPTRTHISSIHQHNNNSSSSSGNIMTDANSLSCSRDLWLEISVHAHVVANLATMAQNKRLSAPPISMIRTHLLHMLQKTREFDEGMSSDMRRAPMLHTNDSHSSIPGMCSDLSNEPESPPSGSGGSESEGEERKDIRVGREDILDAARYLSSPSRSNNPYGIPNSISMSMQGVIPSPAAVALYNAGLGGPLLPHKYSNSHVKPLDPVRETATNTRGRGKCKKRKRVQTACDQCHTMYTPEWRRGPRGAGTLCNACGLRYSRQEKRLRKREEQFVTQKRSSIAAILN